MSVAFSRFAHSFKREGVIALYHALRMRPVYVSDQWEAFLKALRLGEDVSVFGTQSEREEMMNCLFEAKIISNDSGTDDRVIDFFRSRIGEPKISIAYFILTEKCNFSCKYCFVKNAFPKEYKEHSMSIDVAEQGLDRFCSVISKNPDSFEEEKTLIFYGGEPLLNRRTLSFLLEKIRSYRKIGRLPQKTALSLITNGSLVSRSIAELLKEHHVSVGISLDGDSMATNASRETVEGMTVYEDVLRGLRMCQEVVQLTVRGNICYS